MIHLAWLLQYTLLVVLIRCINIFQNKRSFHYYYYYYYYYYYLSDQQKLYADIPGDYNPIDEIFEPAVRPDIALVDGSKIAI